MQARVETRTPLARQVRLKESDEGERVFAVRTPQCACSQPSCWCASGGRARSSRNKRGPFLGGLPQIDASALFLLIPRSFFLVAPCSAQTVGKGRSAAPRSLIRPPLALLLFAPFSMHPGRSVSAAGRACLGRSINIKLTRTDWPAADCMRLEAHMGGSRTVMGSGRGCRRGTFGIRPHQAVYYWKRVDMCWGALFSYYAGVPNMSVAKANKNILATSSLSYITC